MGDAGDEEGEASGWAASEDEEYFSATAAGALTSGADSGNRKTPRHCARPSNACGLSYTVRAERLALLTKARLTGLVVYPLSKRLGDYVLSTAPSMYNARQSEDVTVSCGTSGNLVAGQRKLALLPQAAILRVKDDGDRGTVMEIVERRSLSRARLERHLDELEATADAGITVYVRPGPFADYLALIEEDCGDWEQEMRELPASVAESETGLVLFWSDDRKEALVPPFPVEADQCLAAWDGSPLRALLDKRRLLGVLLLRLGGYSVGVLDGERLLVHKTGQRFVKGRHRAGGQSQRRFARRREKQIRELFDAACSAVKAKFAPYEGELEHIFLGGDRLTLHSFLKRCAYLQPLVGRIRSRILPVAEPRYKALRDISTEIWKTELLTLK